MIEGLPRSAGADSSLERLFNRNDYSLTFVGVNYSREKLWKNIIRYSPVAFLPRLILLVGNYAVALGGVAVPKTR